jgi:heme-degrading monooxygenase HmoA
MAQLSVINTLLVPNDMAIQAESIRADYVEYFQKQDGFVSSTFYKSINSEADDVIKYVNIVVWESSAHFDAVVNLGFQNRDGENKDGRRVLGKGFPEPIIVSAAQYQIIAGSSSAKGKA